MKQCPTCKRETKDHLFFCPYDGQALVPKSPASWIDDKPAPAELVSPRRLRFTTDVTHGMEIAFHVP